jgi:hypothetical protein
MATSDFFYAIQPRWTLPDRFYKIFVARGLLCGARVAGQVYDAEVAALIPALGHLLAKRARLEDLYDSADVTGEGFLTRDSANFRLEASAIESAEFRARRSWWTGGLPNLGSLKLRLEDGTHRKFILAARQDLSRIKSLLAQQGIRIVDS